MTLSLDQTFSYWITERACGAGGKRDRPPELWGGHAARRIVDIVATQLVADCPSRQASKD